MTDKLRECPFCEGEAAIWEISRKKKRYVVSCYGCSCATDEMETREEAIKAWNTRKPMDKIVERLEEMKILCNEVATEAIEMHDLQLQVGARNQVVAFAEAIEIVKGVQNE